MAVKVEEVYDYQNEYFDMDKKSERVPSDEITGKKSSLEFGSSDDEQFRNV